MPCSTILICLTNTSLLDDQSGEEEEAQGEEGKPPKRRRMKAPEPEKSGIEELVALQSFLREKVPVEAVLPSEKLVYNPTGGVGKSPFTSVENFF
jgi:hypothetical protein